MGYERFPPLLATPACPSLLVQTVGILMILDPKFVPLHDEFSVKLIMSKLASVFLVALTQPRPFCRTASLKLYLT